LVLLAGCAFVKSTAVYYRSLQDFPAKAPNAQIPIFTNRPTRPFKVIGRLAFESDQGWNFLRKSMIYNAQIHGADGVWLKGSRTRREVTFQHVPPDGLVSCLPARQERENRYTLGSIYET
jgi:hypothetical protein